MESRPHCYGQMNWVLKYSEDETPKSAICDCQYTNSCLMLTRNRDKANTGGGHDI